ncbi:MAG: LPS export ABC transporter periplasmic protein LptC [Myxococcota bacterium]|jgi:hypothetical protein
MNLAYMIVLAALAAVCAGCTQAAGGGDAGLPMNMHGEVREWMTMEGVGLSQYGRKGVEWRMTASGADLERNTGEAILVDAGVVNLWRRPDGREVDVSMNAPLIKTTLGGARMLLSGGVLVRDNDGNTVVTDFLEYDRASRRLTAPGQVRFTGAGVVFDSAAFSADLEGSVFNFTGGVKAMFDPAARDRAKDKPLEKR